MSHKMNCFQYTQDTLFKSSKLEMTAVDICEVTRTFLIQPMHSQLNR